VPNLSLLKRLSGLTLFAMGAVLTVIACALLALHVQRFQAKRDTAMMIGSTLPALKSDVALLQATVEAEELFARVALASKEEQVRAYVLPEGSPVPRFTKALQETVLAIGAITGSSLSLERIKVDPASLPKVGGVTPIKAEIVLRGSFFSVARLLAVLATSGQMTVRDALTPAGQDLFLRIIEEQAPLSLKAAQELLYTSVINYAAHPDLSEQAVMAEVPAATLTDVRSTLLTAGLATLRTTFQDLGAVLAARDVWPLPLMSVESLSRNGDQWTVGVVMYRR
jgi:hypothetical protein